jgi:hypothetical protein
MLLDPVFTDRAGVEFLAAARHGPNGSINEHDARDADGAERNPEHMMTFYLTP